MKLTKQNKRLALPVRYLDPYIGSQIDSQPETIISYDGEDSIEAKKTGLPAWPDEPPF